MFFAPELEDEGMEFMDGICKTRECAWDVLLSESMKDQEATVEGAIHSIRNMGDVAFVVLRKRDGLLQCVYEEGKAEPASDHAPIYLRKSQAERELEAKGKKLEE